MADEFQAPRRTNSKMVGDLGTYTFEISHRPGRFHGNADGLSRRPCSDDCQHCTRTETGDIDRDGPRVQDQQVETGRKDRSSVMAATEVTGPWTGNQGNKTSRCSFSSTEPPRPWLQKWTNQELKAEQLKDVELRKMLTWKENKVDRPSWEEVSAEGKELKAYWAQWDRLEVRQGLLCRRWENHAGDCITWQFIVPRILQEEVIQLLHDNPTSGHLGVRRTMYRVQERYYWNIGDER
ncbi:Retrovirus-related Pol polyprotein from transposon [Apostichopus japonicus]|uniref:Retrovirus-related Pol polyprotein from transposon n=1 Tax=Stichopus japonicus TaxID=307972 RepID=A0A2G8K8N8_STIJA|nr:Retrovirus-related Pol polyprotein from transposon [Apostichopus japonicus]